MLKFYATGSIRQYCAVIRRHSTPLRPHATQLRCVNLLQKECLVPCKVVSCIVLSSLLNIRCAEASDYRGVAYVCKRGSNLR